MVLDTLAAAHAAKGQFREEEQIVARAIALAQQRGEEELRPRSLAVSRSIGTPSSPRGAKRYASGRRVRGQEGERDLACTCGDL